MFIGCQTAGSLGNAQERSVESRASWMPSAHDALRGASLWAAADGNSEWTSRVLRDPACAKDSTHFTYHAL